VPQYPQGLAAPTLNCTAHLTLGANCAYVAELYFRVHVGAGMVCFDCVTTSSNIFLPFPPSRALPSCPFPPHSLTGCMNLAHSQPRMVRECFYSSLRRGNGSNNNPCQCGPSQLPLTLVALSLNFKTLLNEIRAKLHARKAPSPGTSTAPPSPPLTRSSSASPSAPVTSLDSGSAEGVSLPSASAERLICLALAGILGQPQQQWVTGVFAGKYLC
jgi:hypothetical protein